MTGQSISTRNVSGYFPVLAAILGNLFVTILKFVGFFISGSGALFSEAIHSIADISNQMLLMVGIRRSMKQADEEFSYGYGHERYFWAVISGCCIFFLGAGVTISHGIQKLFHPEQIDVQPIIYLILIISFIVEACTLRLAYKELIKHNSGSDFKTILKYGDPSSIAVLYEDSVALLGIMVALLSILLSKITGNYFWDAIGSVSVGCLLALVAVMLVNKNRKYLMGRKMPSSLEERVIEILEAEPTIEKVIDFKSETLDVNKYRIKCEVEFNSSVLLNTIYKNGFKQIYEEISEDYEEFLKFCVDHTDRVPRLIGNKIDEIEKTIKTKHPSIRHIDIEIN